MSLIRTPSQDDDSLRARLVDLQSALDQRTTVLERMRIEHEAFRIRYQHEVGQLHEELDQLLDAIAEAELDIAIELGEAQAPLDAGVSAAPASDQASPAAEPAERYTSDAVRKLFRDVAKAIHPDLSRDREARDRRHALMVQANRAYAMGDLAELRRILDAWHGSADAVTGTGPEAERERLLRRIAEAEAQLDACDKEMTALHESPVARLKTMVEEAAENGKDLMADTIRRLQRDILAARNRLEAIRWRP